MELTKEEKALAYEAYQSCDGDFKTSLYEGALAVLEARAASAVDQGLRKAAQDFVNKLEMVEPAINGAFAFQAIHGANYDGPNYGEELNALKAALTRQDGPVIGDEPLTSEFLIPEFLAAVNDIGRYGLEKYGEQSFQARRLKGDVSRGTLSRCHTSEIGDHIREHYRQYMAQIPHDHFKDEAHQLAAIAFNAMMEFWFAGFAAPRPEPSQAVNYVSAPHDAKTMRCESCYSDQWPQCPNCGALLIEKPESTQEPSQPMSGTMQDEVRITDREPPSQQEADSLKLKCLSCNSEVENPACQVCGAIMVPAYLLKLGYRLSADGTFWIPPVNESVGKWIRKCIAVEKERDDLKIKLKAIEEQKAVPQSGQPPSQQESSVQPSTDDVVERSIDAMLKAQSYVRSFREHSVGDQQWLLDGMTAALAVARAGWHSWESVEKAIRAEFVHQFKSSYAHELGGILYGVQRLLSQQDAKAEPAERVTDPAVEAVAMVICTKCGARVGYPELHNKWHNIYAELDAQGGNS